MKQNLSNRVLWLVIPLLTLFTTNVWGTDPVTIVSWTGASRTANSAVSPTSSQTDNSSARLMSECALSTAGSGGCAGAYYSSWTNDKCIYITSLSLSGYTSVSLDISLRRRYTTCTASFYASTDGSTYAADAWTSETLSNSCTNYNVSVASNVKAIKIKISGGSGNLWLGDVSLTGTPSGGGCDKKVTIAKGSPSNGSFSLNKTGAQETCSGLTVNVTDITPASGYKFSAITQSGVASGVTIDQSAKTVTYAANTTGSSTINVTFEAKGCTDHNGTNVVSGASTSYSYGPVNPYYEYSTREILYTKTDLNLASGKKGTIKSIYFEYAYASAMTGTNSVKIYMANTALTALSTSNYVTSFTEVYDGPMNCSNGWNEITLTTPFAYNGVGNLIVIIDDNSNKDEGTSPVFKYHTANTTTGAQIYTQSSSTNADPTASATWTSSTAVNYRPNTKFCIQESDMPTYTVSFSTGTGNPTQVSITEASGGAGITLPAGPTPACSGDGWTFIGWKETSACSSTTTAPDLLAAGSTYKPTSNCTLYAVYYKLADSNPNNFTKVTSNSANLTSGYYVIYANGEAMNNVLTSDKIAGKSVSESSSGVITSTDADIIWTIYKSGSNYQLYNAGVSKYLEVEGSNDLGLNTSSKGFTLAAFNTSTGQVSLQSVNQVAYQFHYYSGNFSAYGSQSTAIFFYKRGGTYNSNPSCKDVKSIAVKTAPTKTTYCEGAYFDPTALVITVTYDDDTYEDIGYSGNEAKFTFSPTTATALTTSHTSVSITYGGKSTSQSITVNTLRTIARAGSPAGTVTGGTFTVDNASACVGATITLTATPSSHYSLSSWTITKTSDGTDVTSSVSISGSSSSPATFTMPDYNVTVNATYAENAYRTVVFKNSDSYLFDDGGSATTFDGTNKWKQKVYVGEVPVWPTALTDGTSNDACDETSDHFYGWASNKWSGVLDDTDDLDDWDGGTVYTSGPFANVAAGTGEIVYHAVWAERSGSASSFDITASDITQTSNSADETTFTKLSTDDFGYVQTIKNGNNSPSGWNQYQLIQLRGNNSGTGQIYNKTSITGLTKLRIVEHSNASALTVYYGTTSKSTSTSISTPFASATGTQSVTYKINSSESTTTADLNYYDINIPSGNGFFYLSNSSSGGTAYLYKITVYYSSYTYSNFLTTCCDKKVTLSDGSPTNGTVSFSPAGPIATCSETASDRTTTMTITPSTGYYLSDYTSSGVSTSNSPSIATSGSTSEAAQEISLVFAQNTTSGTYTAGATFSQIPVSGWSFTNHRGGAAITDEALVVYVGQKVQLDITYSPANAHADHKAKEQYSQTSVSTYILSPTKASGYFTFTGKASTSGSTTTIALTHNDGPTKDVNVEVRPLPSDTYLDLIHGVVFANQTASLSDSDYGVDFSYTAPGSTTPDWTGSNNNDCEEASEHLIGWIDSEWADKHLGEIPTTSEVTAAKLDDGTTPAFHASGASMTAANRTYYAVWAKEVE